MSDIITEHADVPQDQQLFLHRVSVVLTVNGSRRRIGFDPAKVHTLLWDPRIARQFRVDDQPPLAVNLEELPRVPSVAVEESQPGDLRTTGVTDSIYLLAGETEPAQWFKLEKTTVHQLHMVYEDPRDRRFYELVLPVRSRHGAANEGTFPKDAASTHVDMVFWNGRVCAAVRREMKKDEKLNHHCFVSPNGTPVVPCPDVHITAPTPLDMPVAGTTTCAFCYHYDNCQWVCTAAV